MDAVRREPGFILDIDGTIVRGNRAIPGAKEAISKLRRQGHPVVFVTNALESPSEQADRLNTAGVATTSNEIITAPQVLKAYLLQHLPDATLHVISDPPLLEELEQDFRTSEDPNEIDAVVVSCDRNINFHKINIGFQALRNGARFLAVNADATCPLPSGEIPDAGAVIGALEGCSKRKLELVFGKPSHLIIEAALGKLKFSARDCMIVGDSLESDISMGYQAGIATALVLTGVTQRENLALMPFQPDYVLESIADVPALLNSDRFSHGR